MKKMLLSAAVLCLGAICFGSETQIIQPVKYGNGSLASTIGGLVFSDATRAMYHSPRVDLRNYKVLGKVTGEVSMRNFVLLVNLGDTGFEALKRNALRQYPDADDIVNFDIDSNHFNILFFYIRTSVRINGIAVKYLTK